MKNNCDTLKSTIIISACSYLSYVLTNQRSVILTSFSISLDPSISLILSGMQAIFLIKIGTKNLSLNIAKVF